MRIRAVKAKHGDALIITTDRRTLLVDGGPPGTYVETWKAELEGLPRSGRVDLLMISHIDSDHIAGVLELTADLITAQQERARPLVDIKEVWHNSFSDMIASEDMDATATEAASTQLASVFEAPELPVSSEHGSAVVLASVGQGRKLREDIATLAIRMNRKFTDQLVIQGERSEPWSEGDLIITAIGPGPDELADLRKKWKTELPKLLAKEGKAETAAATGIDKSVSNLASIVAIAKQADGGELLLTGDARGDLICEALRIAGRLTDTSPAHFDAVKLPHHGSNRNVTDEFFKLVTADHYIVSGNGGHGNPEPASLEMLFSARPELDYTVHMTYGPAELAENATYQKDGNVDRLAEVLDKNPKRREVLRFPAPGANVVEFEI